MARKWATTLLILLATCQIHSQGEKEFRFVDTTIQNYSYALMMANLDSLAKHYPHCLKYEQGDSTYQGRPIPVVQFGDSLANKFVMIQSTIHAREFMATQLTMAMLEYYTSNYETEMFNGKKLIELFKGIRFIILPMVNPDGVEISQNGIDGAVTDDVKEWLSKYKEAGTELTQIKANALGVDINRNFRNGFGKAKYAKDTKDLHHYMGAQPYSEVESRLLLKVSQWHQYSCFLNYHTSGNLIFYGCMNARKEVNEKARNIAARIKKFTGYPCFGPKSAKPSGTWADEVEIIYKRPSVTIELGTKNPVPIEEFKSIYKKNINVWAAIAELIQNKVLN